MINTAIVEQRLDGIAEDDITEISSFTSKMTSDNYTLQVGPNKYLNVSKYLVVSSIKLTQDVAVAINAEDPKKWIRLAKLEYSYAITEIFQKDQNNQVIGEHAYCPERSCSRMVGTCTHEDVPQMFHPLYLNTRGIQIDIPPPLTQEKRLSFPSPDVSKAIVTGSVRRRRKKLKDEKEQAADDKAVQELLERVKKRKKPHQKSKKTQKNG
jgi:hypothetical protein